MCHPELRLNLHPLKQILLFISLMVPLKKVDSIHCNQFKKLHKIYSENPWNIKLFISTYTKIVPTYISSLIKTIFDTLYILSNLQKYSVFNIIM